MMSPQEPKQQKVTGQHFYTSDEHQRAEQNAFFRLSSAGTGSVDLLRYAWLRENWQ